MTAVIPVICLNYGQLRTIKGPILMEILRGWIVCLNRKPVTPDFCGGVIFSIFFTYFLVWLSIFDRCFRESQARMNIFLGSHFRHKITALMPLICQKYRLLQPIKGLPLRNYLRGCITCSDGDPTIQGCCGDAIYSRFCHVFPDHTSPFNSLFLEIEGQNKHIFGEIILQEN